MQTPPDYLTTRALSRSSCRQSS